MEIPVEKISKYKPKIRPNNEGKTQKFTEEQRLIICKMYAEGNTLAHISKYALSEFNVDYTVTSVLSLVKRKELQPYVKEYRQDYLRRVKEVNISNKRFRLDDLQYARNRLMEQLENNLCEDKGKRDEFRATIRALNEVLTSSRDEMEKKPLLPGMIIGDFSDRSDEELIRERDELLRTAGRVIESTAVGIGSDPEGTKGADKTKPS